MSSPESMNSHAPSYLRADNKRVTTDGDAAPLASRGSRRRRRKRTLSETRFATFAFASTVALLLVVHVGVRWNGVMTKVDFTKISSGRLQRIPRESDHLGDSSFAASFPENARFLLSKENRTESSSDDKDADADADADAGDVGSGYEQFSCQDLYSVIPDSGPAQCAFARTCNGGDGIYVPRAFCSERASAEAWSLLWTPLFLLWLVTLFRLLSSTADSYFSPALELCSGRLGLSPPLAGATLLAPGNGAPDVSATIRSVTDDATKGYQLALGELTGGAMLVSCVVGGLVVLEANGMECGWTLARDVGMLVVAICAVGLQLTSGKVTEGDVWLFLGLYGGYVGLVALGDAYQRKFGSRQNESESLDCEDDDHCDSDPEESTFVKKHPLYGAVKHEHSLSTKEESEESSTSSSNGQADFFHNSRVMHYMEDIDENDWGSSLSIRLTEERHRYCGAPVHGSDSTRDAWEESKYEISGHFSELYDQIFVEHDVSWAERFFLLLELPFIIMRKLTVPIPCEEHYNRGLVAMSTAISPIWVIYYLKTQQHVEVTAPGVLPFFILFLVIIWAVALLVFRYAPAQGHHMHPSVATPLALYGFAVAATWIDEFANHLVGLLEFAGILLRIPGSVMGLTILAWGNSMGDLTANVAMARRGRSDMAATACFAGPVFNMLVGLGMGFWQLHAEAGTTSTDVVLPTSVGVGFAYLLLACISVLIAGGTIGRGTVTRQYGYFAIALYVAYLVTSLVLECSRSVL